MCAFLINFPLHCAWAGSKNPPLYIPVYTTMYCTNCIFYTLPSLERVGSPGSVVLTKYCHAACFDVSPNQDINNNNYTHVVTDLKPDGRQPLRTLGCAKAGQA